MSDRDGLFMQIAAGFFIKKRIDKAFFFPTLALVF